MIWRSISVALALAGVVAAAGDAAPAGQRASGRELFVGSWRLVSDVELLPSGVATEPRGPAPVGLLIYDQAGNMAAQIANSDPPISPAGGPDRQLPEATPRGYMAYFGTYTIDEQRRTITHHVRASLVPSQDGSEQVRTYEFSGNRLTLSPPARTVDGTQRVRRITWERVQ